MKTIGIDASKVVRVYKTGTEYYSYHIIKNLIERDSEHTYILYSPKDLSSVFPNYPKHVVQKILPFSRGWSQIRLSLEFLSQKPDLLFVPAHTLPLIHPAKTVTTLHDLGFKYFPELYTPFEQVYHTWAQNKAVRKSTRIIAPSEYTKRDLMRKYVINPQKITVIYHGFDQTLFHPKNKEDAPVEVQKYLPYLFYIGRLERKKNILGLLEAFELLRRERAFTHKLLLAGHPGYGYEEIQKAILRLPKHIQKDIVELGYIDQDRYALLLRFADVFVFPSFFEGFGLPLIEAMASGVPVVASNVTSIPEVVGSAGQLLDPKKPFEWASVLSRVLHSQSLRKSMISKGLARSSAFSWDKAADKLVKVFREVLDEQ